MSEVLQLTSPNYTNVNRKLHEIHSHLNPRYSGLRRLLYWRKSAEYHARKTQLDSIVETGDLPVQYFVGRVFANTPIDELRDLDGFFKKRHRIPKSGSELDVYYDFDDLRNPLNGVFVNTINSDSAQIWAELCLNGQVPVAPILRKDSRLKAPLRMYSKNFNQTRIFSRFCGLSVYTLQEAAHKSRVANYGTSTDSEALELAYKIDDFSLFLDDSMRHIRNQIADLGLKHGHAHKENFTVEFFRKTYLNEQLSNGKSINSVPVDPTHWTYDPNAYLLEQSDWEPVVRLIDFDTITTI